MVARSDHHPGEAEIQAWMISYLSSLLEIAPEDIDTKEPLASYGIDSTGAVGMVGDLGGWLNRTLDPEVLYSYPTIEALTRHLVGERSSRDASGSG